jgi:hypothetical protein
MSINLNSILLDAGAGNSKEDFIKLCLKVLQDAQTNPSAEVPKPSPNTVKKWVALVNGVRRAADKKPKSRFAAFMNIRTSLSLVIGIKWLFSFVNHQLVFTTDDLSVLIHKSMSAEKPTVITTTEAVVWLEKQKLSVSNTCMYVCSSLSHSLQQHSREIYRPHALRDREILL